MSRGLSRRAAVPAPVAIVACSAVSRRTGAADVGCASVDARVASAPAAAASPPQPIRLVTPFATCNATDFAAPPVAQGPQERPWRSLFIDNRTGVAPGGALVATSAPDSDTLSVFQPEPCIDACARGSRLAGLPRRPRRAGWRALAGGVHGVRPLRSGPPGAAGADFRRDRRNGRSVSHNPTTACGATKPERAAA